MGFPRPPPPSPPPKKKKMCVVDRWPLVVVRLYNVSTILSPIATEADMQRVFFFLLVANKLHNFGCEWEITYIFW